MDSNLVNYYNPGLQNILDELITQEKYGEFKPILNEIMQRRAFEFDISLERMREETERLVSNLESIRFMTEEEIASKTTKDTMAVFKGKEKKMFAKKSARLIIIEDI